MANHRISSIQEARILEMHAAGASFNKIRLATGCGIETAYRVLVRHGRAKPGKTFLRKIQGLCDCGRPAARAGQLQKGDAKLVSGCERCLRLESNMLKDETEGRALKPMADQPEFSLAFLARISAACDAFFARRGLRMPSISRHYLPAGPSDL
jgi:hypothetical protein